MKAILSICHQKTDLYQSAWKPRAAAPELAGISGGDRRHRAAHLTVTALPGTLGQHFVM